MWGRAILLGHRIDTSEAPYEGACTAAILGIPSGNYARAALLGEATTRDLLGDGSGSRSLLTRLVAEFPGAPEAAR